jgi:hypothetical protein
MGKDQLWHMRQGTKELRNLIIKLLEANKIPFSDAQHHAFYETDAMLA